MELTAQYLRERFRVLNNDYFDNELPEPQFVVTNARTQMGQFSCKRVRKGFFGKYVNTSYKIKVSEYYEQTAEEIDDTLLHEMIHFLIAFRQLRDTSAHGQLFRKEMNRLNREGCQEQEGSHVGLANVLRRMRLLYGQETAIAFENNRGGGARIELFLPFGADEEQTDETADCG